MISYNNNLFPINHKWIIWGFRGNGVKEDVLFLPFPHFPHFPNQCNSIQFNTGDNHMKRARQINFDTQGDVYVRACLTADRFHLTLKKQL